VSAKKKALGRGFESLIPTELFDEEFDPTSRQDERVSRLIKVKLNLIEPNTDQPRKKFDEVALNQLSESIKVHGVLQPIVVVQKGVKYQIVAGERRYRASILAGKKTIPAIVRKLSDQNRLELSLIENVQRSDLSVIEVATSYLKLRDQFNLTLAEIGRRVGGKSLGAISNTLRLLRLPKPIIEALDDGRLTEGQARPLIGLDENVALEIANSIEKHDYSARQVEDLVKKMRTQSKKLVKKPVRSVFADFEKSLSDRLQAKVTVKPKRDGSGRIEISYKNQTELNRLKKALNN
jgi:ParB family chromosome partitioning protein